MKLKDLKPGAKNPRLIDPQRMKELKESIESMPQAMALKPIIYDPKTMQIIAGNQRYKALLELGYKEIPDDWAKAASDLTDEQKRRFGLIDNISFGRWDYDLLSTEFTTEELLEAKLDKSEFKFIVAAPDDHTDKDEEIEITTLTPSPLQGKVENKGDYLLLEFKDLELFEKVKTALSMGKVSRSIPFATFVEACKSGKLPE